MDTQVTQLTWLTQSAHEYFLDRLGVSFEALAAPIDAAMPAGKSVRGSSVYSTLERARRQDDASLPMGEWEHDLKRADWDKVSAVALDALRYKSKDLQVAAWLLEAQIQRDGFAGVGPCMLLINTLCERYWDGLFPLAEDGDLEHRANVIRWINQKLLPALRLVPITNSGRARDYSWADWEQARRNDQLRASVGSRNVDEIEGISMSELMSAITATDTDAYAWLNDILAEALAGIDILAETVDRRFGDDAPGLGALGELLQQIRSLVQAELHKRGVRTEAVAMQSDETDIPSSSQQDGEELPRESMRESMRETRESHAPAGAIRDRADAYARLAEAADFLMRVEPHSPVPYLVQRATEWGRMNTAELYQELFLKLGGQINIFEMLGLEAETKDGHAG